MVKIYLKYGLRKAFGVITSSPSNIIFDPTGKCAITGALEQVAIWNVRRGTIVSTLGVQSGDKRKQALVTRLCLSPDKRHLAVGYADGIVRIWDLDTKAVRSTFKGHKSEVTALCYDKSGLVLASGGSDTDLVVWDVVSESGLFRLRGHKNAITDLKFLEKDGRALVSSSKDFLVKIWDLETQHCIQTLVGHRAEVWSFDVNPEETRLVTVCDKQIRFYKLGPIEKAAAKPAVQETDDNTDSAKMDVDVQAEILEETDRRAIFYGIIDRKVDERAQLLRFHPDGSMFAIQSSGKAIEFLQVHNEDERKNKKRRRKRREKKKVEQEDPAEAANVDVEDLPSDEYSHKQVLRTTHKIQSFGFPTDTSKELLVALQNNSIELYQIRMGTKGDEEAKEGENNEDNETEKKASEKIATVELPGHRGDIRSLALSSNDEMLLSTSSNLLKIWNMHTLNCIRTIKTGYGLSAAFIPGDSHVVIGTKAGSLELYDLQAARQLEVVEGAHKGAIWGIQLRPDKSGIVTCSADKTIKFWDFDLIPDRELASSGSSNAPNRLSLVAGQTIEMTDDVLSIKYSKDGKFLAASLLDTTVRVFFADSMKFFLSLYGHKLPVMSLDISDDSQLIITASADKNVKIWGLDFGDCHKSLFAHDDSVMQVAFVPNTHYFFSVGKDGLVKYWDGDKFEHLLTMEGHQGEIWALTISSQGDFVVTGSHDRSLRVWERTEEQLFLEEQRENELEQAWEDELAKDDRYAIQDKSESGRAGTKTIETIKSGEKIIEALELVKIENENLDLYHQEIKRWEEAGSREGAKPSAPKPSPFLLGRAPNDHMLQIIKSIRSAELEETLLVLPFADILQILTHLDTWIKRGKEIELCTRCLFFLLQMHQVQLSANKAMRTTLHSLRENTRKQLQKQKDTIGFNLAAMNFMRRTIDANNDMSFFEVREKLAEAKKKGPRKNFWED